MPAIVIHESCCDIGLKVGQSPQILFVVKTDSQVTLTQLRNESVTTRSRPFANKFNYARDMCHGTSIHPASVKAVFEPGKSQKADGLTQQSKTQSYHSLRFTTDQVLKESAQALFGNTHQPQKMTPTTDDSPILQSTRVDFDCCRAIERRYYPIAGLVGASSPKNPVNEDHCCLSNADSSQFMCLGVAKSFVIPKTRNEILLFFPPGDIAMVLSFQGPSLRREAGHMSGPAEPFSDPLPVQRSEI